MKTPISPIHWECYVTEPGKSAGPARVVDLRTLPEEVKVSIIKAAINVGFRYHNGEYDVAEDSEENEALEALSLSTDRVRNHMHEVNLVPCP